MLYLAMTPTCVQQKFSVYIELVIHIKEPILALDLSVLSCATTMGRTKLLVSCLLLITLPEAFLGSGRLSKNTFWLFLAYVNGVLFVSVQIRAQGETLFYVYVGVWAYDLRIYQDLTTLEFNIIFTTVLKYAAEISLSHFYFNRGQDKKRI